MTPLYFYLLGCWNSNDQYSFTPANLPYYIRVHHKTGAGPLRPVEYLSDFWVISEAQEDPAFRHAMDARRAVAKAAAKAAAKAKRKKTMRNPFATWIRKKISRLNYGKRRPGTKPTPQLDAEALIRLYRRKRCGASITNDQYQRHFDLLDTLYFWADHRTSTLEILVMIDIDVHDADQSLDQAPAEGGRRHLLPGPPDNEPAEQPDL